MKLRTYKVTVTDEDGILLDSAEFELNGCRRLAIVPFCNTEKYIRGSVVELDLGQDELEKQATK